MIIYKKGYFCCLSKGNYVPYVVFSLCDFKTMKIWAHLVRLTLFTSLLPLVSKKKKTVYLFVIRRLTELKSENEFVFLFSFLTYSLYEALNTKTKIITQ